ncbi:glycosyltransferase family 4 protein [Nocardioides sp. BP30]|uniref:glycosyltransferase family 4 protein n=1 Tax=Nocardioides sp. BP30 TaxID=3036374 RepID=UPI0024696A07|nr:glycosyltransferase family 4 protein [Nocardioides sp. BP30]WGL53317.1 glycosyltransferase family 4 protein [Nocardioides sp. BP30]
MNSPSSSHRVLIIVQNLPVPFDRRVWLEATTLRDAGYDVTVVCPQGHGTGRFQQVDGVTIRAYRPYAPGGGALGYLIEYVWSFLATAWLVSTARRQGGRFAVLQACNPPDIFWPIARWYRWRDRTRFVFDHHDLCPELYESRFPTGPALPLRGLKALERATFRTADRVVSTNESYAAVAHQRGDVALDRITVVRTGPDPARLRAGAPKRSLKRGHTHLAAYIGVMGPQDGVDIVLAVADHIVNDLGRDDLAFTVMGAGDCWADLVADRDRRGLAEHVEMPGRVSDEELMAVLSTADVGLSPDPLNPLNDVSTMNKTMEYMAFGLPVVAFDLVETRVSAGDAATYADPRAEDPVVAYAEALLALLEDPGRCAWMGRIGRERIEERLAWAHQAPAYLAVYDELTGRVEVPLPRSVEPTAPPIGQSIGQPTVPSTGRPSEAAALDDASHRREAV